jgi:GntR family transcriptional regulator
MKNYHLSVDFSSSIPLYKQIHDQIIFALKTGSLKPGDKLTPVLKLAARLGVSVNTVAKAYRILELQGYLIKQRGHGAYITHEGYPYSH